MPSCPSLGLYENEDYFSARSRAFSINSLVSQRLTGQYPGFQNSFSNHTESIFGNGKILLYSSMKDYKSRVHIKKRTLESI